MTEAALFADIGGTNARFSIAINGVNAAPLVLATRDHATLDAALRHALATLRAPRLDAVAVCAAGPPKDGAIVLTNCHWDVSEAALREATGAAQVVLVNDFTALAAALPMLQQRHVRRLGGGPGRAGQPRAVIGPGTGLGMSAWLPGAANGVLLSGEGGHMDLAAGNDDEALILARLRAQFGHVSAERVLSGDGLVHLYRAMHPESGDADVQRGEDVAAHARNNDQHAVACVRQFCRWLGAVAGDLALLVGAHDGVYLAGGILPAWGELFAVDEFLARFVDKGRYEGYLQDIPIQLITTPDPAFLGLPRLLAVSP